MQLTGLRGFKKIWQQRPEPKRRRPVRPPPNLNWAALDYLVLSLAVADKNDTIATLLFHDRLFCSIIFK